MKYLLLTALVACGISIGHARESRNDSAVLDRGIFTHTSSMGVLRLDVATGAFEISYSKGGVYRDVLVPYLATSRNALIRVPFMLLRTPDEKTNAVCTNETENMADAAGLVSRLCSGGQSEACRNARDTFANTVDLFNECIFNALNTPSGGGAQPAGNGNQPGQPGTGQPGNGGQPGGGQPGNGNPGDGNPVN